MTKLESQYQDLTKALDRLKEASLLPSDNTINQDATIQRFEFTFELCWKIMQTIVSQNKQNIYGPKNVIRVTAQLGIIDDPQIWFDFLEKRNLTAHTYDEKTAQAVYQAAKKFVLYVEELLKNTQQYLSSF